MGQKIHPNGFRLITTNKHLSNWYQNKKKYSFLAKEDFFIREQINIFFKNILQISKIEINRNLSQNNNNEFVKINIYSLFPRSLEISKKIDGFLLKLFPNLSSNFLNFIKNSNEYLSVFANYLINIYIRNFIRFLKLKTNKNYFLRINFIRNSFENAELIAKYISEQLEKRIPFRRVIKQTIKKIQYTKNVKGIKIQVSGRLNGIEIARTEWKREGQIPLQTLSAPIDYAYHSTKTVYGILGIKIWLFNNNN